MYSCILYEDWIDELISFTNTTAKNNKVQM